MKSYIYHFLIVFIFPFFSFGATYYVSVGGSGGGTGLDASNKSATLQNIFDTYNLAAGGIIDVAAGTYAETGVVVGADDEGFTIQGAALSGGIPTSIFDAESTARWLLLGDVNNDNITINKIYIKDHKQVPVVVQMKEVEVLK